MSRKILVSGASIAGCSVAYWLGRFGFDVTVVEQAPAFRDGGQNIDVRGVGREVLRRMRLEEAALSLGTGEEGTAWVDDEGKAVATFLTAEMDGDGPTAELEILRGDLARLLHNAAADHATFRFGDTVAAVDEQPDGVKVQFARGQSAIFDAFIIAEGVGSASRELVFANENDPRWMDLTMAYFTIDRAPGDDRLWRWYNATHARSISLRPDNHGTTRAMLSVQRPPSGEQDWDSSRQKAWLRETFADAGWQAERVLRGMDMSPDFYFDTLRQVRMKRWSSGRVALTGDAAWCVTPLGGIGATLALTGSYVLAAELARNVSLPDAFAAYETMMRSMVDDAQGVPKIAPRILHPRSRMGIRLLHGMLGVASLPALRDTAAKLFARPPEEPDLSRYDDPPLPRHPGVAPE